MEDDAVTLQPVEDDPWAALPAPNGVPRLNISRPATFDERFIGPQGDPIVPGVNDTVNWPPGTHDKIAGDQPVQLQSVDHNPFASVGNFLSQFNPISSAQAEEEGHIGGTPVGPQPGPHTGQLLQIEVASPDNPSPVTHTSLHAPYMPGALRAPPQGISPGTIPQRLPTSTRNPLDQGGNVDLPSMQADPKGFQKNVDLVRSYPNTTAEQAQLPHNELADAFIGHVKDNLLWLHDQVPDDIRSRSQLWYDGGNKIVNDRAQQYGIPPASVAGVIAAQSPQKDWYQNVGLADRLLDIYHTKADVQMTPQQEAWFKGSTLDKPAYQPLFDQIRGKSLNDIRAMDLPGDEKSVLQAMWIRTHDEAHNSRAYNEVTPEGGFGPVITKADGTPAGIGWGSLGEISKGVRSIESNGDTNVISQAMGERHKVRNFYNNLISPNAGNDITIDTHAVAAGLLRPLSGNSLEVAHNFNNYAGKDQPGASGSAITGSQGLYPLYAEAYRQAAAERGILPRQMQSITWEAIRGAFPDTFKTAKNNDLVNTQWLLYRSGRQSLDDTRQNILGLSGGIRPPSWHRSAGQADAAVSNPGDAGALPQPQLPGPAAGQGGTGGGSSAGSSPMTSVGGGSDPKLQRVLNTYGLTRSQWDSMPPEARAQFHMPTTDQLRAHGQISRADWLKMSADHRARLTNDYFKNRALNLLGP